MDIMLDSLNLDAIKIWKEFIPLAGVTSNPSIARMEGGRPFFQHIRQVRDLVGDTVPIHVQVIAQDYEGILADAARIRQECGPGTYIKVPTTKEGLAAIQSLKRDGYFVTATAIYTAFQGLLASRLEQTIWPLTLTGWRISILTQRWSLANSGRS